MQRTIDEFVEVPVVAKLDQGRPDRRIHDAGGEAGDGTRRFEDLEEKGSDGNRASEAALFDPSDLGVLAEATACEVQGHQILHEQLKRIVDPTGIGDGDRDGGADRPSGTAAEGLLGCDRRRHDWPDVVVALAVVVVVVGVGVDVVVVEVEPEVVPDEEVEEEVDVVDPDSVVDVVAVLDTFAVPVTEVALEAVAVWVPDATKKPSPTAPRTAAAPAVVVNRRTCAIARSLAIRGSTANCVPFRRRVMLAPLGRDWWRTGHLMNVIGQRPGEPQRNGGRMPAENRGTSSIRTANALRHGFAPPRLDAGGSLSGLSASLQRATHRPREDGGQGSEGRRRDLCPNRWQAHEFWWSTMNSR